MNLARLFWRLLRYRVAVMLVLFMLLAAVIRGRPQDHAWQLLAAAIALAFSYVSATSSNDLADEKIDKLNHPNSAGRPLIQGLASRRDMWMIFGLASVGALLSGLTIGLQGAAVMAGSVLVNILYSLPPARLSYRTYLAPLVLGVGYVGIPYLLGLTAVGLRPRGSDWAWAGGLYLLFVGRIILKDFRDRKGDAAFGKPTFLLAYGKPATCLVSLAGLVAGGGIIVWQVRPTLWLSIITLAFLASIAVMLYRLWRAPVGKEEQLSIGVGAKMGNGLLIALLCAYLLRDEQASMGQQIGVTLLVTLLFFGNYLAFWNNPAQASLGYKG